MKDGQKAILIPGISTMKDTGTSSHKSRVNETLKAITEEVTVLCAYNGTGNSKVMDNKGKVFFCNSNDLQEWYPEFYG